MLSKRTIDGLVNINPSNLGISNSFSISPYYHTYKDIVSGSFNINTALNSGGFADGQTVSINNVASSPNYVFLIIGTPSTGTSFWDRIGITQSGSASSYNSSTNTYTLGYNLVSFAGGTTSGTATIFYILFC
jgi:hypothetical protein